jgi:hypothetical protein
MSSRTTGSDLMSEYVSRVKSTKKDKEQMGNPCTTEYDRSLRAKSDSSSKRALTTKKDYIGAALLIAVTQYGGQGEDAYLFNNACFSNAWSTVFGVTPIDGRMCDAILHSREDVVMISECHWQWNAHKSHDMVQSCHASTMLTEVHELLWTSARQGNTLELAKKVLAELDDVWKQLEQARGQYTLSPKEAEWIRQNRLSILAEQECKAARKELELREELLQGICIMRDSVFTDDNQKE